MLKKMKDEGMSLIEVMVSITILTLALAGFLSALLSFFALQQDTKERTLALQYLRAKIEELQSEAKTITGFQQILSKYIVHPDFDVEGLKAAKDDKDGKPGKVIFPLDQNNQLMETATSLEFGMPRDLNGDGKADSNATTNYTLLPLIVRIEWQSDRKKSLEIPILLTNKTP